MVLKRDLINKGGFAYSLRPSSQMFIRAVEISLMGLLTRICAYSEVEVSFAVTTQTAQITRKFFVSTALCCVGADFSDV